MPNHRQSREELSFGEKKMLERARNMLVSEISVARGEEKSVIEHELNHILFAI